MQVNNLSFFVDDFSPRVIDVQSRVVKNEFLVFNQATGKQTVIVAHTDDIVASAIAEADVPIIHDVDSSAVFFVTIEADATVSKKRLYDGR